MNPAQTHLTHHADIRRAELLLDPARLSTLLGREVTIAHLRIKPGHNVLVAWREIHTGEYGWTEATCDPAKFINATRRAGRLGQQLEVHSEQEVFLFSGSVWADRKLAKALTALHRDGLQILRYNPQRRLVAVTRDGLVVRVHADSVAKLTATSARWQQLGIPAISMFGRGNLAVSAWWGTGNLLASGSAADSRTAGETIAALHRRGRSGADQLAAVSVDPVAAATAVSDPAPWLRNRVERLGQRLAVLLPEFSAREAVTELHGDLSPDQILVDRESSELRIIDFDRAGAGPAARDVGSYLAFCRQAGRVELGEAFLAGYHAEEPNLVLASVAAWEAYAHLTFALSPLRGGEPTWPSRMEQAVELAETAVHLTPPAGVDIEGEPWRINRAWPDHAAAVTLELTHPDTAQVRAGIWDLRGIRFLPPGADPVLTIPPGKLISHRAGRRAVIHAVDGRTFTKVVRPGKAKKIIARIDQAVGLHAGFRMPEVVAATEDSVTLAALPGRSLHTPRLFSPAQWTQAWEEVVSGLQRVWAGGGDAGTVHLAADEAAVVGAWVGKALGYVDEPARLIRVAENVCAALLALPAADPVTCHRDLHSKQLLWSPEIGPGVLDVDTACAADPALDLGNLRAHALWRRRQDVWDEQETAVVLAAIDGAASDRRAVAVYQQATLVRLVCVYAFRPRYRAAAMRLLQELGDDHDAGATRLGA